eukprot:GFUD01111379.1.p1 GENE.GFUD01111379.1~~GFUD01111379.1.p1  ORF type:complete len:117 (+),score=26.11 GFUD01111379.1:151-501(+)
MRVGFLLTGVFYCSFYIQQSEEGYVYPGSHWVGNTPVLQFLIRCSLVDEKMNGLSTNHIYRDFDIKEGIKKLQGLLGLEITGEENLNVKILVTKKKCPPTKGSAHKLEHFIWALTM